MPYDCARRRFENYCERRLEAIGADHPDRAGLEATISQTQTASCPPACSGVPRCAWREGQPVLRFVAGEPPETEPESRTIIIND